MCDGGFVLRRFGSFGSFGGVRWGKKELTRTSHTTRSSFVCDVTLLRFYFCGGERRESQELGGRDGWTTTLGVSRRQEISRLVALDQDATKSGSTQGICDYVCIEARRGVARAVAAEPCASAFLNRPGVARLSFSPRLALRLGLCRRQLVYYGVRLSLFLSALLSHSPVIPCLSHNLPWHLSTWRDSHGTETTRVGKAR